MNATTPTAAITTTTATTARRDERLIGVIVADASRLFNGPTPNGHLAAPAFAF
jgi:hypothetical protein